MNSKIHSKHIDDTPEAECLAGFFIPSMKESNKMEKRYLTEKEVAAITGLSLSTLRNDRSTQRRFPYVKYGRSVRYSREDIINYMEGHKIKTDAV